MALKYQKGFGNTFLSESVAGVLPQGQNSPQKVAFGLYAEQISGSAFTAPRHENKKTWVYRVRPSVQHGVFKKISSPQFVTTDFSSAEASPNQFRWDALPEPSQKIDFVDSWVSIAGMGSAYEQRGCAVHLYSFNQSMSERYFYNADAELLIVPEKAALIFRTELGVVEVAPGEVVVVPKGIRFAVDLSSGESWARGYICENFGAAFKLPELGPIGANGLANAQDFEYPVAAYEKRQGQFELIAKLQGNYWSSVIAHSPLDVVAWRGNYAPYKYNLDHFNTINTVSYDHPDPSIFTVLSSPSEIPGVANIDFVIFPPRWMVAEKTFRPPYFHRNCMSEFMGLIKGAYDAKAEGFVPGGSSLHNCMSGHGPDAETFEKASNADLKPHYIANTMAFMFESRYVFKASNWAMKTSLLQKNYSDCWKDLAPAKI